MNRGGLVSSSGSRISTPLISWRRQGPGVAFVYKPVVCRCGLVPDRSQARGELRRRVGTSLGDPSFRSLEIAVIPREHCRGGGSPEAFANADALVADDFFRSPESARPPAAPFPRSVGALKIRCCSIIERRRGRVASRSKVNRRSQPAD